MSFFTYSGIVFFLKKKAAKLRNRTFIPLTSKLNRNHRATSLLESLSIKILHNQNRRVYGKQEKLDVVFLFQAASFWPSWETVWQECVDDERINPVMYLCDDIINEKSQFKTARDFLNKLGIAFKHISEVNLSEQVPHVMFIQTPYDTGHRPPYLRAPQLASLGIRIAYITYGIEISDSVKARSDHFNGTLTKNAWRIYTFSKDMIKDYKFFSPTGGDSVRSIGHPKFDYLTYSQSLEMPEVYVKAAKNRKIVLWKVHFPKKVKGQLITPSMNEYKKFTKLISKYDDLFFIFMPHPKFYEHAGKFVDSDKFFQEIESCENAMHCFDDDYRPVLINSDYVIIDRSALMIEAAVLNVPVLYVEAKRVEELVAPVQRIVDTFYKTKTCEGIESFLTTVVGNGEDLMCDSRSHVVNEVISGLNTKAGLSIKEDIISAVLLEEKT